MLAAHVLGKEDTEQHELTETDVTVLWVSTVQVSCLQEAELQGTNKE